MHRTQGWQLINILIGKSKENENAKTKLSRSHMC